MSFIRAGHADNVSINCSPRKCSKSVREHIQKYNLSVFLSSGGVTHFDRQEVNVLAILHRVLTVFQNTWNTMWTPAPSCCWIWYSLAHLVSLSLGIPDPHRLTRHRRRPASNSAIPFFQIQLALSWSPFLHNHLLLFELLSITQWMIPENDDCIYVIRQKSQLLNTIGYICQIVDRVKDMKFVRRAWIFNNV